MSILPLVETGDTVELLNIPANDRRVREFGRGPFKVLKVNRLPKLHWYSATEWVCELQMVWSGRIIGGVPDYALEVLDPT